MISGTCLCGAVRYEVDAAVEDVTHCHCAMCRKHHGAPFASFVEVAPSAVRWLAGEERLATFQPPRGRSRRFCDVCGSVAPTLVGDRLLLPVGNLFGDMQVASGRHVCVDAKPAWHTIADGLPQLAGAAPGWTCAVESAPAPVVEGQTRGSCACGDVTFSVTGKPARWMQCHCSRCRRARSAAHGSNLFYPLAQFAWGTGREQLRKYTPPDAQRFAVAFCTRCGGGAPVERDNVPFVLIPAALLDADLGARPEAHIHVASKAPWYSFQDELPEFAELPT